MISVRKIITKVRHIHPQAEQLTVQRVDFLRIACACVIACVRACMLVWCVCACACACVCMCVSVSVMCVCARVHEAKCCTSPYSVNVVHYRTLSILYTTINYQRVVHVRSDVSVLHTCVHSQNVVQHCAL